MTIEGWAPGPVVTTIYARSATEGGALEPQVLRCRAHAERLGLEVNAVFTDHGSGDIALLSGMVDMLKFIGVGQPTLHVVIVDDVSRLGRNIEANAHLCRKLEEAGAELLMATSACGAGPAPYYLKAVWAAVDQFERKNNRRRAKRDRDKRLNAILGNTPYAGYIKWLPRGPS